MANFKTHISVAAGASFVAGLSAYTLGMATIPQTLLAHYGFQGLN